MYNIAKKTSLSETMRIGPGYEGDTCFIETVRVEALANISETLSFN